jgi:hypothetical protein
VVKFEDKKTWIDSGSHGRSLEERAGSPTRPISSLLVASAAMTDGLIWKHLACRRACGLQTALAGVYIDIAHQYGLHSADATTMLLALPMAVTGAASVNSPPPTVLHLSDRAC